MTTCQRKKPQTLRDKRDLWDGQAQDHKASSTQVGTRNQITYTYSCAQYQKLLTYLLITLNTYSSLSRNKGTFPLGISLKENNKETLMSLCVKPQMVRNMLTLWNRTKSQEAFTRSYLILPSISNHNKERPLPLSYPILNENPDSVIHFLPMHGEKLSLKQKERKYNWT